MLSEFFLVNTVVVVKMENETTYSGMPKDLDVFSFLPILSSVRR